MKITAFAALGKPAKVSSFPAWAAMAMVSTVRLFNRHQGALLAFSVEMGTGEVVAPSAGDHTLGRHFEELA